MKTIEKLQNIKAKSATTLKSGLRGEPTQFSGRQWRDGTGQVAYYDPRFGFDYGENKRMADSDWEKLKLMGKTIYLRESCSTNMFEAVRIGSLFFYRYSVQRGLRSSKVNYRIVAKNESALRDADSYSKHSMSAQQFSVRQEIDHARNAIALDSLIALADGLLVHDQVKALVKSSMMAAKEIR